MIINKKCFDSINESDYYWDRYIAKRETETSLRDRHGRIDFSEFGDDYFLQPDVSENLVTNRLIEPAYPGDHEFAVCLTHDVDYFYPTMYHELFSYINLFKSGDIDRLKPRLSRYFERKCDLAKDAFETIFQMETEFDAKSTFFFMATDKDVRRIRYDIEDIALQDVMSRVVEEGHEIGLHGGYYSYNDIDSVVIEKKRIEKAIGRKVSGYRGHYLRFEVPDTWRLLSKADFAYDTTYGFADHIGFRNGLCHPFLPYDLHSGTEIDIVEFPMAVMDGALFSGNRNIIAALSRLENLVEIVRKNKGVLVLNWHSNNFNCPFRSDWEQVYHKVLEMCQENNAWFTTCEEYVRCFNGQDFTDRRRQ